MPPYSDTIKTKYSKSAALLVYNRSYILNTKLHFPLTPLITASTFITANTPIETGIRTLTIGDRHGSEGIFPFFEVDEGIVPQLLHPLHSALFATCVVEGRFQEFLCCGQHEIAHVQDFHLEETTNTDKPHTLKELRKFAQGRHFWVTDQCKCGSLASNNKKIK